MVGAIVGDFFFKQGNPGIGTSKGMSGADPADPRVSPIKRADLSGLPPALIVILAEIVGAALLWALEQGLGPDFTPAVREAWVETYALVANVMKAAAAEVRRPESTADA